MSVAAKPKDFHIKARYSAVLASWKLKYFANASVAMGSPKTLKRIGRKAYIICKIKWLR